MTAVQAMTGQGGWPMTVVLTPDGRPFFGGTYFPPVPRYNMPSFVQVLNSIIKVWQTQREDVEQSAGQITDHLQRVLGLDGREGHTLDKTLFDRALANLDKAFDEAQGGFGSAPKFPPSMTLEFLLRMHLARDDARALQMAEKTLQTMAYGGLYDQIGGGFARYSTDNEWLVPHFEKMLYDNALLARVYLHAWQISGNPLYKRITEETLDFVVREMRHEEGGFYSSYDADSEGEEGKFYVWDQAEIESVLGGEADLFNQIYDVTARGNWEGQIILRVQQEPAVAAEKLGLPLTEVEERLAAARQKLYDVRAQRVWPGLDDKVLTAWNGLMLAAFAAAGRALSRPDYTEVAVRNARFLQENLRGENGRLLRTWKAGSEAKYNAYLEDYAYLADGLLALYHTTFDYQWFGWARELADLMLTHFRDEEFGGFYDTSDDHEALLTRPKDIQDNATPSGNAMAAGVLLRLALYTGDGRYWDVAEKALSSLYEPMAQYPNAFAQWLQAASFLAAEPREVAIVGDYGLPDTEALIEVVFEQYRPDLVTAVGFKSDLIPLLAGRKMIDDKATAYVCRRFVCQQPVTDPDTLRQQLL
jgi:uncharacterized protein